MQARDGGFQFRHACVQQERHEYQQPEQVAQENRHFIRHATDCDRLYRCPHGGEQELRGDDHQSAECKVLAVDHVAVAGETGEGKAYRVAARAAA